MLNQVTKQPERSIASLKSEIKEEHDWRMRLHEEVKELRDSIAKMVIQRDTMWYSLMSERFDLEARIQRIDMRLRTLGFKPPGDTKNS